MRYENPHNYAAAWLDRDANSLFTNAVAQGQSSHQSTLLPAGFAFGDWHNLAVEMHGTMMTAEVTDARLHDPYAYIRQDLPASPSGGRMGLVARGRADVDSACSVALYTPSTQTATTPEIGRISQAYSDEVDHTSLSPKWSWVRTPAGPLSLGKAPNDPPATAVFDFFRVYRP